MTTRFVQVSWGLEYTEVFLNIDKIKAYIQSYQNGVNIDNTTKMSERIALSAQDRMDEEIHQHIRISDTLAKEELHDYLTGWINYFDSNLVNTKNIENPASASRCANASCQPSAHRVGTSDACRAGHWR